MKTTNMRRYFTIIVLSVLFFGAVLSQNKKERIETFKIAFISNALNLTPEEAQKFWPVFNEYEAKKLENKKKYLLPSRIALNNLNALSDKDIEMHINNIFTHKSNEIEYQKDLYKKLKSIISLKKIGALATAEANFKLELIKKLKQGSSED